LRASTHDGDQCFLQLLEAKRLCEHWLPGDSKSPWHRRGSVGRADGDQGRGGSNDIAGHEDGPSGQRRALAPQMLQEGGSIHPWHPEIANDGVDLGGAQELQGGTPVSGGDRGESPQFRECHDALPEWRFVVYEE
jgi:hypothetical protein